MGVLFGTDGVRGVAGAPPLDPDTIYKLASALTELLRQKKGGRPRIIIGRDTRASGPWIERVLIEGIRRAGGRASRAGVVSTPGVSYLTRRFNFDAGIVISASHNPFHDNGIKIFSAQGLKLSDQEEEELERRILSRASVSGGAPTIDAGCSLCELRYFNSRYFQSYLNYLASTIDRGLKLDGLKLVIDCGNGAVFRLARKLLGMLGAETFVINASPDGKNINDNSGALYPQAAQRAVLERGADLGVAYDGDADRAIFIDEAGRIVDGDQTLYIFSRYLKEQLGERAVVATVMSNLGLEVALARQGIRLLRTPVGDRYVLEEMLRQGLWLGGEQSGHIILRRYSPAGDGLLTTLKLLEIMRASGLRLSQLADGFERFPQVLVNVRVREKVPFDSIPEIAEQLQRSQMELGETARVVLRYSGTEPLARVMIEGPDKNKVEAEANKIAGIIAARLA